MPLDLDLCQRLKEVEFPQERWPQLIWSIGSGEWALGLWYGFTADRYPASYQWCAAPEALDVLDWLQKSGIIIYWRKESEHISYRAPWVSALVDPWGRRGDWMEADTAVELIRQVLDAMEG